MSKLQPSARRSSLRSLPAAVGALALALLAASWAQAKSGWDDEAAKRKAEYIFLESQNAFGQGNYDDYAAMVARAYSLDSADTDIAAEWGFLMLNDDGIDSATAAKAYGYLSDQFFADPSNYNAGITLARYANMLGRYPDQVRIWSALDSLNPTNSAPAISLAKAYLVMDLLGDSTAYQKCLGILDRLESGTGKTIELSNQRVVAYYVKRDSLAVVKEMEDLLESAPNDSRVACFVGQTFHTLGNDEKAIENLDLACRLDSTNGMAYMARASLYSEMGDSAAYDREVFHALHSPNLDVETKLDILHDYVSKLYSDPTQEPRIRELFGQLQQMHAGEPAIHFLFGSYLYTIKDYAGAAEQASYSVALEPGEDSNWSTLVQMSSLAQDTTAMIVHGKEAMARFPDNLYYPIVVATAYRMRDDLPAALATLDSVHISQVANAAAVSSFVAFKGDVYSLVGDTARALEAYDMAIELNPDNNLALNNAAYFMAQQGIDLDKAEQYITKVMRTESENPTYLDTYAWVLFKKKDYSMAKMYIDMTLNIYESQAADEEAGPADEEDTASADVYEHAGDIYFMNGEPDRALEFWEKALALDPGNELLQRKVKHKTYFYK